MCLIKPLQLEKIGRTWVRDRENAIPANKFFIKEVNQGRIKQPKKCIAAGCKPVGISHQLWRSTSYDID